jgi:hypothetical protein
VPRDRRLDDEAPLAEQVERGELMGEQERVAQRRDDRRADEPQPCGGGAMALMRTMESGHGVAGSWLPGAA